MKKVYRRLICLLCSLMLAAINITVFALKSVEEAPADAPNESISAVYGGVLNDYINLYGVVSDEHPSGFMTDDADTPNGLVYADIMNFDNNDRPYLVLFLADASKRCAACHIWTYDEALSRPKKVAEITKPYMQLAKMRGAFSLGWNNEKRYIVYKEFDGNEAAVRQYFTVINGEAFSYVEEPEAVSEAAVINFSSRSFVSDVDISDYNNALSVFFDKLKNAAADSVTYKDIADELDKEDMEALELAASSAAETGNFDILDYRTMEEYEEALAVRRRGSQFYLISNVYGLGNEIYYVRFSTDRSFYNYAVFRHTERSEKYQTLRIRLDCIPLSDRELKQMEEDYSKSPLLYKKAKSAAQGYAAPTQNPASGLIKLPKVFSVPSLIDRRVRKPAVYASAALTILLVTGLWVYMYGNDEEI
ncbi:MAG: hypothetical protein Q4G33_02210 [bacterium]|nr:hypothetical protein [bacterium]